MSTVHLNDALVVEKQDGVLSLKLLPKLVQASWAEVEQAGNQAVESIQQSKEPQCLIDLSELNYMASAQVALIVRVWKAIRAASGHCVVLCQSTVVLDVIRLAGLDKIWTIEPSRAAALQQLRLESRRDVSLPSPVVYVMAIAGTVLAVAGLTWGWVLPGQEGVASLLKLGGAVVGFIAGLCLALLDSRRRRYVGLAAVMVSVAVAVTGYWQNRATGGDPDQNAAAASQSAPAASSDGKPDAPAVDPRTSPLESKDVASDVSESGVDAPVAPSAEPEAAEQLEQPSAGAVPATAASVDAAGDSASTPPDIPADPSSSEEAN
ncbi:MAG: hypothetical protein R3B90_07725 [Planctomycetaceae bacterium]